MKRSTLFPLLFLTAAIAGAISTRAAEPPTAQPGAPRAERESKTPPLYWALGPSSEADLARLRAAIGKLTGVSKVETRAEFGEITVVVDGDGRSTQSLLSAAARSVGYDMRQALPRHYAATGPTSESDLQRLEEALEKVYGAGEVTLGAQPNGAALRLTGLAPTAQLSAAARPLGYSLQAVTTYVVSGPNTETDLARLRSRLSKAPGVDRLEMRSLSGGATLLIRGDAKEVPLAAAAKELGYDLWPLANAPGPRLFRIDGPSSADLQKLRQVLGSLEGVERLDITTTADGQRLSVTGRRARQDDLVTTASQAGFALTPVEAPVTLPTLASDAERATPPDYVARVLNEKAQLGEAAPGFTALGMDGVTRTSLKDYLAPGKPVVVVFGSCTCPRFMAGSAPLERLYRAYRDRVTFVLVYGAEAHPGSIMAVPVASGGKELRVIPLIATEKESLANLRGFVKLTNLTMPAVIESPVNSANENYSGYPNRIYVIKSDGKIVFKGAPGPSGFKVPQLADWLRENVK